ncbi:hypothetical protein [Hymenobacter metallicola]|nr:hypothetical protein [Hymenobacter metallicola]
MARTQRAAEALQWQDSQEFRWHGRLYDVVRQQATADSITYFCWHDQGEEKLLAGLQEHLEQLSHPDPEAGKAAKKLLDHLAKLTWLGAAPGEPAGVVKAPRRQYVLLALRAWAPVAGIVSQPPPEAAQATT